MQFLQLIDKIANMHQKFSAEMMMKVVKKNYKIAKRKLFIIITIVI